MKIIHVIPFSPKYHEYRNEPKPKWFWAKPDGSFVGIWGYDWADLIGKSLIKNYDGVIYEVWQVDQRADKVYSAELQGNLFHKNFPGIKKKFKNGLKVSFYEDSSALIQEVKRNDEPSTFFLLPASTINPLLSNLVNIISRAKIVHVHLLHISILVPSFTFSVNPIKFIYRLYLKKIKTKHLLTIRNLLITNDNIVIQKMIRKINPKINIFTFRFGNDLDFWINDISKAQARSALDIPKNKFVIVLSQRLIPAYQIDKFMEALAKTNVKRDYKCYITGHGTNEYEKRLKQIKDDFKLADRVQFVGYVSDEQLKQYFIAADVFGTFAKIFAGSTGAVKAMACGTPILHVKSGSTYEFLKKQNAGVFIDPINYVEWSAVLEKIINGTKIKTVPREEVEAYFSWEKTAKEVYSAIQNAK